MMARLRPATPAPTMITFSLLIATPGQDGCDEGDSLPDGGAWRPYLRVVGPYLP
jgi:hypothetical protein